MHAQFYLVCQMFWYLVDFTMCNIIMMVICRVVFCDSFCQNPFRQNTGKKDRINVHFYLVCQMFCYLVDFILCNIIMMVFCSFSVRIHSNKTSVKYKDMCAQPKIICHIIHMLIYHMQYYHGGHILRPFVWVFPSEFIHRKHKWKTKIYRHIFAFLTKCLVIWCILPCEIVS